MFTLIGQIIREIFYYFFKNYILDKNKIRFIIHQFFENFPEMGLELCLIYDCCEMNNFNNFNIETYINYLSEKFYLKFKLLYIYKKIININEKIEKLECNICFDNSINIKTDCKHYLCEQCCHKLILLYDEVKCPYCRNNIEYFSKLNFN
ncbi:Hypothetical protein KVN_LOCUS71 [uncultured virus]|nr:Hypothetical protein KVN_LOCUS71 [uncultured virus]